MNPLPISLNHELASVIERVQHSLVVLHNGQEGFGAGIIWRQDGLIITNHHVVSHGRARSQVGIRAGLADGRELPAQVVAQDPEIDLALLRVEADGLPQALIADTHSLRVGQLILAIGHPWGQRGAVTCGLVSGLSKASLRRKRGEIEIIRSDVRLAPGNSGGPMVDAAGGVVGVNTMIVGGDQGVAVPSHVVNRFVEQALSSQEAKASRVQRRRNTNREAFV